MVGLSLHTLRSVCRVKIRHLIFGNYQMFLIWQSKNLSDDLYRKVLENYNEYDITKVANVKEAGRNIWVINLENLKHLLLVRFENGELEETYRLNKN